MKTLWLARNDNDYQLFTAKPFLSDGCIGWNVDTYIYTFCIQEWHMVTGIKLRELYCVQVSVTKTKTGFTFCTVGKPFKLEPKP